MATAESFSRLWIWEKLRDCLPWYYAVATNRRPAKYLIARRIPCELDLNAEEDILWKEHEKLTYSFLEVWRAIRAGEMKLSDLERPKTSLMDLTLELVNRMLSHCNFCRWNCKVDRSRGIKYGTCQLESISRVGCYFHHIGEELVFRGTGGSGTVFFTSCNMRCVFCQNGDISHDKDNGIPITPQQLALMAWQLRLEGCHNINFVGGESTIHLHTITKAISLLGFLEPEKSDLLHIEKVKSDFLHLYRLNREEANHEGEFNTPILWNSNFFMSHETMKILRPLVDIWLPDFKFGNDKCSVFLSKTPWYMETVGGNHKMIYDWEEDLVIRHLIMPNHVECCTKPVLQWIAKNMPKALVNIMDQFHPDYSCAPSLSTYNLRYRELSRYPTSEEIQESYDYAKKLSLRYETITFEKKGYYL